jgi:hypothetical protein
VALQDLDPVAVRVLDEEEARHQRALALEFLDVGRIEPLLLEAAVLGVQVADRKGDVAVAVAMLIRLLAALVDGELDLEVALGVAQIDQREVVEVEAVRAFSPNARS